jgi:tetratricopeptide (TPR) repeat protein
MVHFILLFLISSSFSARAWEQKDIQPFEDRILLEAKPFIKKNPLKAYELRVLMAREYQAYGFKEKALEHYEEALKIPVTVERAEPLFNTVILALHNRPLALKNLKRLKESPEGKMPLIKERVPTLESHIKGNVQLPKNISNPLYVWARDEKIEELIKEKKFGEAFRFIEPVNHESLNINSRIRYDLLSSAVLKKVPPRLWCEQTLKRYPTSITWSMRMCRYLRDKREGKKSFETIEKIKEQLKEESPSRMAWINMLEAL